MTYAIIQLQGKQYKVSPKDQLVVDKLDLDVDKTLKTNDVLLVREDKKTQVGAPFVKGAEVELKVVEQGKGEKIRVAKYRSKSRYRKVKGHRQHLTKLEVMKIKLGS